MVNEERLAFIEAEIARALQGANRVERLAAICRELLAEVRRESSASPTKLECCKGIAYPPPRHPEHTPECYFYNMTGQWGQRYASRS